jgi:hypothetical protein
MRYRGPGRSPLRQTNLARSGQCLGNDRERFSPSGTHCMSKRRLTKYTNFHHRRNNGPSRPLGRNRQRPNIVIDYLGDLFRSLHTGPVVQIEAQHPIDAHKAIVRLGAPSFTLKVYVPRSVGMMLSQEIAIHNHRVFVWLRSGLSPIKGLFPFLARRVGSGR